MPGGQRWSAATITDTNTNTNTNTNTDKNTNTNTNTDTNVDRWWIMHILWLTHADVGLFWHLLAHFHWLTQDQTKLIDQFSNSYR